MSHVRVDNDNVINFAQGTLSACAQLSDRRILLISGVSGAGKSALAATVASQPGWIGVSEDVAWDHTGFANNRGDPLAGDGLRRHQATRDVVKAWATEALLNGKDVVIDFLMYQDPPLPLFDYEDHFKGLGVKVEVVIVRPSLEVLIQRDIQRGRPELGNRDAMAFQHRCYHSPALAGYPIVDTSNISIERTYVEFVKPRLEALLLDGG